MTETTAQSGFANGITSGTSGSFRAFVVRKTDDDVSAEVQSLTLADLEPQPVGETPDAPQEDDLLIKVDWSGINYKDAMVTLPGNRVARTSPLVPGVDVAGTVVSGPADWEPGTAVLGQGHQLGVSRHGGFAEYCRVPAAWAIRVPDELSTRDVMIVGTAGYTAAISIAALERHGLTPDLGPVLVTGASGGVGSFAVALLADRGYEVVASSGKAHEHQWLTDLGARRVIGREDLDEAPGRVLGPARWAGAVDCVGGRTLEMVLRSLRRGAAVAASGLTAGADLHTTIYPFITREVALIGIDSAESPAGLREDTWRQLGAELKGRDLEIWVERQIGLDGLATATADIIAAKIRGRVLVDPSA